MMNRDEATIGRKTMIGLMGQGGAIGMDVGALGGNVNVGGAFSVGPVHVNLVVAGGGCVIFLGTDV